MILDIRSQTKFFSQTSHKIIEKRRDKHDAEKVLAQSQAKSTNSGGINIHYQKQLLKKNHVTLIKKFKEVNIQNLYLSRV